MQNCDFLYCAHFVSCWQYYKWGGGGYKLNFPVGICNSHYPTENIHSSSSLPYCRSFYSLAFMAKQVFFFSDKLLKQRNTCPFISHIYIQCSLNCPQLLPVNKVNNIEREQVNGAL